jgi:pimeloyl-ACP methyl ester carboxylesterase
MQLDESPRDQMHNSPVTSVFLTPIGMDHEFWMLTGVKAAAYDYPGHGDRPLASPGSFTLTAVADEIARNYDSPLDLVGVSAGAIVAQYVAVRHPSHVRSMVLACGIAPDGPEPTERSKVFEARAEETLLLGMAGVLESTLGRWFTREALLEPEHPGVAYARRRLLNDDPISFAAMWRLIAHTTVRDEVARLNIPTTVLGARQDAAAPITATLGLFDLLRNARLEVIEGPHMLPLERPRDFAMAVERHFDWVR